MQPTAELMTLDMNQEMMRAGDMEVARPSRLPAVPWRDPHTVDRDELRNHIALLEKQCLEHPKNADLRTCLGMAHAMNFDVYKSMDRLDEARTLEPNNFFAQMKFAELHYRLRILHRAEDETAQAIRLAGNAWELSLARKQINEIRRLKREGLLKPAWTKSMPRSLMYAGAAIAACAGVLYLR
ncbi:MAG: hypothetical protein ABI811_02425 [Acidobacteriota bacterium]